MKALFFPGPKDWRDWLEKHHEDEQEILVGFYKKGCGKPSITWPESVDGALCFGWIDGVRRSIDEESYSIRFTPRKAKSYWSNVNINRVAELTRLGCMHESGLRAFENRAGERSGVYAYEQKDIRLPEGMEGQFRENARAWEYFSERPAWYRRTAIWWVISAKREETRERRLQTLIADSERCKTIAQLTRD